MIMLAAKETLSAMVLKKLPIFKGLPTICQRVISQLVLHAMMLNSSVVLVSLKTVSGRRVRAAAMNLLHSVVIPRMASSVLPMPREFLVVAKLAMVPLALTALSMATVTLIFVSLILPVPVYPDDARVTLILNLETVARETLSVKHQRRLEWPLVLSLVLPTFANCLLVPPVIRNKPQTA
jgi:hypothetical protein